MDCLFCKLRDLNAGAHPYEDERCFALEDLHPQAPTHLLVIPKKHLTGPHGIATEDEPLLGHLVAVAADLARARGLEALGYRLVMNCNEHGGQTVFHLHLHLLGGRQLTWPPG